MIGENTSNLGSLMQKFGINSRTLAEMLNVHYSLVSKWLNGKRQLKPNSEYMKKIIEVFLSLDAPNHNAVIRHVLAEYYPSTELANPEMLALYLGRYLSTGNLAETEIATWDLVDHGKISARSKIDIYNHEVGRQSALIRLINSANVSPIGQEILVYGTESVLWQNHRNIFDFLASYRDGHESFLANGGAITIIHSVDRSDEELVQSILHWLPFHLSKRTRAFYIPEYSLSSIKASITILKGKAVLFGVSAERSNATLTTYYSTDSNIVKKAEEIFAGLQRTSIPLFEHAETKDATIQSLEFSARNSVSIMLSTLPFQYCLSHEKFYQLLEDNGVNPDRAINAMTFYELDQKRLASTMQKEKAHVMINYQELVQAIRKGIHISYVNWIVGKDLWVPPQMVKEIITGLFTFTRENPNFLLYFLEDSPLCSFHETTLLVKENTSFLTNTTRQGIPGPLTIKEPTIVAALYRYMDSVRRRIPKPYRDIDYMSGMIEHLAD